MDADKGGIIQKSDWADKERWDQVGGVRLTSTPYDDVFRTLLNDCSELIIPVINEVFGAGYTREEKIVFSANEHFMNRQDGDEVERITDSSFKIIGKDTKKYHLECQSSTDDSMLVRIFEYDTQIALDGGEIKGGTLTVTFPHSAVLYLRCGPSMPEGLEIRMVTPGGEVSYGIPLMKSQDYTIEGIFQKRLLFLLPFHIFSHEKRFGEYERDEGRLGRLRQEYVQIKEGLEACWSKERSQNIQNVRSSICPSGCWNTSPGDTILSGKE